MDYLKVIEELNSDVYERDNVNENFFCFSYQTNSYSDLIMFNETILWSSEDDGREIIDDEKEPLVPFIKKAFNEWVDSLSILKF